MDDLIEARRRAENPSPDDIKRLKDLDVLVEPCRWCGQPVRWDPWDYFAEAKVHETETCPTLNEWRRCKE
jgi:hypothetical protein